MACPGYIHRVLLKRGNRIFMHMQRGGPQSWRIDGIEHVIERPEVTETNGGNSRRTGEQDRDSVYGRIYPGRKKETHDGYDGTS